MQFNLLRQSLLIVGLAWCGLAGSAISQTKSESFLPDTTQGVLIVSDVSEFVNGFNSTQLGELYGNPEITVFFESIQGKLDKQLAKKGFEFGAKTDEVLNIVSGEMSIALIRPTAKDSAVCFLANVADDPEGAENLLKKAAEKIKTKGGKDAEGFKEGDVEINAMALPREKGDREVIIYSTVVSGWLVAAENKSVVQSIVRKIQGRAETTVGSLAEDEAFQTVMARSDAKRELNDSYVKWFVKPLEFAETVRDRLPKRDEKDYIGLLKKHGYDSIQGIGGIVGIGLDEFDVLAQCYIYAPPVGQERFVKAAAALDFDNPGLIDLLPEKWLPASAASHLSFTWDLKNAFEKSIPMIEDLVGREGAIRKALEGIKKDPQGAKVDIENDIIAQLGKKITLVSDPKMPVSDESERLLLLVKIDGDHERVKVALDKIIAVEGRNGGIVSHDYNGFKLWEVHPGELREKRDENHGDGHDFEIPGVEIPGVDCSATEGGEDEEAKKKDDEPLLKKPLVATQVFVVAHGHLIITNNLEYSKLLLDNIANPPADTLRSVKDFRQVDKAMNDLVKNANSLRRYVRMDNAYRSTYELIRNGKLPESKSLLATIINSLIPAEENDAPRAPKIDGSLLPKDFDKDVAPYLGNIGWCVKTEPEGWLITSILIAREE